MGVLVSGRSPVSPRHTSREDPDASWRRGLPPQKAVLGAALFEIIEKTQPSRPNGRSAAERAASVEESRLSMVGAACGSTAVASEGLISFRISLWLLLHP